jgi:ubiquinone/menaquinone biosynthesis C-methylase UbiE
MASYYDKHLAAERLQLCYDLAPLRVRQYLAAESEHVAALIKPGDAVLDLGCGYGRVMRAWATKARQVVGVDSSAASVALGRRLLGDVPNCTLLQMDAGALGFGAATFDLVACIQNGISAFKVPPRTLVTEAVRVTRPGGRVLLSTYAASFWPHRLEWFKLQAEHGLLGAIDWNQTRDGQIVCQDGFRATTFGPNDFAALAADLGLPCRLEQVDESSLFCEIAVG